MLFKEDWLSFQDVEFKAEAGKTELEFAVFDEPAEPKSQEISQKRNGHVKLVIMKDY